MDVTFGLAFLAGLASFLSPCVISLVPAYVGYLSGKTAAHSMEEGRASKWTALSHGFAFVLGFSLVFILLGLAVSAIGNLLFEMRDWLARIGGVVVVLFGLHMTGLLRIPFLEYDLRPKTQPEQSRSYLSSFLLGIFFSAGWSPCVGPVLGAILLLALHEGSIIAGFVMLTFYSIGMAIPFLVAALAIGWMTHAIRKYRKALHWIEVAMGILLILVGIMLFLGIFERMAGLGNLFELGL